MFTIGYHSSALATIFRWLKYNPYLYCRNFEFYTKGINSFLIYASGETDVFNNYGIVEFSHCIIIEGKGILRLL